MSSCTRGSWRRSSYKDALLRARAAAIVTPSNLMRGVARALADVVDAEFPIVICSKGVEEGSGLLPIDVMADVLGARGRFAVLSGPNHAEEVVRGVPAATVVASPSLDAARLFQDLFATEAFRTYTSDDVCGVELCGAFKNVIAIAVGLSYGMGFGDNTAALLLTRGLAEMSRLVVACGGQALTCMGLAGAGDMVATCMSRHSRNRRFGEMLAAGGTLADFAAKTHRVAEGAVACKSVAGLAEERGVELPIAQVVRGIVWEGLDARAAAEALASRPLTTEFYGLWRPFRTPGVKALTGGLPRRRSRCREALPGLRCFFSENDELLRSRRRPADEKEPSMPGIATRSWPSCRAP